MIPRPVVAIALGALTLSACSGSDQAAETTNEVTDVSLEPLAEETTTTTVPVPRPEVDPPTESPTTLVVADLIDGEGPAAEPGDTIWVDYTGILSENGSMFDNSYDRGEPIAFTIGTGAVIDGWDQGLVGARPGMQRRLDIPGDLAYGDDPPPGSSIGPGSALTFMVEVRAVVSPSAAEDTPEIDPADHPVGEALGIADITVGAGHVVVEGDTAIAHTVIVDAATGEALFNTWSEGQPLLIEVTPGYTIDGLYEGLLGMAVGGLRVLSIPSDLAFGSEGAEAIGLGPDAPVILVVELAGAY